MSETFSVPRLLSDDHAIMALGALSKAIAERGGPNGGEMKLYEIEGFPDPPEWLELWNRAVAATVEEAGKLAREEAGAHEPTHDERLEVEAIAQAHYEAYSRLNLERLPDPIAWEALPDVTRSLMMATIADMLASGVINVGPAAAHPKGSRELWVIFDGMPDEEGPRFVEVEDLTGASHGSDRGLTWEPHPANEGMTTRLGPFPAARAQELPDREKIVATVREVIVGNVNPALLPGAPEVSRRIVETLWEAGMLTPWKPHGEEAQAQ
jgi:hypothetical protein